MTRLQRELTTRFFLQGSEKSSSPSAPVWPSCTTAKPAWMRSSVLTRACTWPSARAKPRDGGLTQPRRSPAVHKPVYPCPAAPPVGPACRPGGCSHCPAPVGMVAAHTPGCQPFALGVASGDPAPDGMVLWTRLLPSTGEPLPAQTVHWELAHDEGFARIVQRPGHRCTRARPQRACGSAGWSRAAGTTTASCWGRPPAPPAAPALRPPCMRCRGACARGVCVVPAVGAWPLRRLAPCLQRPA